MRFDDMPAAVNRAALVATPVLFLLSGVAIPKLATDDKAEVDLIAAHPTAWYWFTLCSIVGSVFLIPATVGLLQRTRERAPGAAVVGAGLLAIGAFVALIDSATQLVYWQMGVGDRTQMVALLHRYEGAPGATLIFMVGALSLVSGSIVLAVALVRAQAAPVWAALLLPLGMVTNIAGFASGSRAVLIGSSVLLLAGLGRIALADDAHSRRAPAVATAR